MKQNGYLILGFSFFGLLIGYTTGITTSEISLTLLTALFAFVGGKIFIDLKKEDRERNRVAGAILLFFSILFLVGLNAGIYVKVNKALTSNRTIEKDNADPEYLKGLLLENDFETKYRSGQITADSLLQIIFDSTHDK